MRAHYVGHNAVTRIPRRFVYLDSEARNEQTPTQQVQTFRCAVTCAQILNERKRTWATERWAEHMSTEHLWNSIDAFAVKGKRTVVVAHKLDYDLRVTNAFAELLRLGWTLEQIRVGDKGTWCTWKESGRTLVCIDSLSWIAKPLHEIGKLVGIHKLDLPDWEDSDEAWLARCRRDVEILAEAYRRLLDWIRADDLGNWKPTGAGQSWAAYRHKHMQFRLLVHENSEAREAERTSAYTGRCEAWRHGKLTGGPFTEWDYSTAYARIGVDCKVPVRLLGELVGDDLGKLSTLARGRTALVECTVSTDSPRVPTKAHGGITWPVGTFQSTLWLNEVELAQAGGAQVVPHRAWLYSCKPALKSFCEWCLSVIDERNTDVDPIVRAAVKHWSRSLIGRFSARWSTWEEWGVMPWSDVALGTLVDHSADEVAKYLHVGLRMLKQTAEEDSPDAVPSIMAWIMAEARCRLWRAAEVAGLHNVAYLDTDSLIVDRNGHERLSEAALAGFRVKGQWNTLQVLGPRQIVTQGRLRVAGVRSDAVKIGADEWESDAWQSFGQSLASRGADRVVITRRVQRVPWP